MTNMTNYKKKREKEKMLQPRSLNGLKINIMSKLINLIQMLKKKTTNGVKSYRNYKKKQMITYKSKTRNMRKIIEKEN